MLLSIEGLSGSKTNHMLNLALKMDVWMEDGCWILAWRGQCVIRYALILGIDDMKPQGVGVGRCS